MSAGTVGPVTTGARRAGLVAATVAYLAVVGYVTLTPDPSGWGPDTVIGRALSWLGLHGLPQAYAVAEAAANVAMFVPFGVLAWLWLRRRWAALLLGVATSSAIELCQWAFLPSRYPSAQDVVMNSLGTLLGVAAAVGYARLREHVGPGRGGRRD